MEWARHYNAKWIAHFRGACRDFPLRPLLMLPTDDGSYRGYVTPHIHGYGAHLAEVEVLQMQGKRWLAKVEAFKMQEAR